MKLQMTYNRDRFQKDGIVYYDPSAKKTINLGTSAGFMTSNNVILEMVNFINDPSKIADNSLILIDNSRISDMTASNVGTTHEKGVLYNISEFTLEAFCKAITEEKRAYALIDVHDDHFKIAMEAANSVNQLFRNNPLYQHIIRGTIENPQIIDLWDVLFSISDKDEQMKYLRSLAFVHGNIASIKAVAEQILQAAPKENGFDLLSQEEQIEAFIKFSKEAVGEESESVPDTMINAIKGSQSYQQSIQKIKDHGFGLSKTQQFNVLQSAGYLGQNYKHQSIIYNLSDMGAGKTLMTVQSIYLMDVLLAHQFEDTDDYDELVKIGSSFMVPNKNLIAPELSVESSWVDTFKLFYDVEKKADNRYILTFTVNDCEFQSVLNVVGFTVTNSGVKTTGKLPALENNYEYLVIDEVHQIVHRQLSTSKFFAKGVEPSKVYKSFVLSGTLSNLTTESWYNYIKMMKLPFNTSEIDNTAATEQGERAVSAKSTLKNQVSDGVQNIRTQQHRYFDDDMTVTRVNFDETKMTNEKHLFNALYAPQILELPRWADGKKVVDSLTSSEYSLTTQPDIIKAPNFELFYQLVGNCAITAESNQVAEELFGDQKVQHKANVINVSSDLSAHDIELLATIHNVTMDYDVYKSKSIAEKINNAILNLNDGLSNTDLYQVINRAANNNTKFLQYLTTLDVNLLQELPKSSLIQQPTLESTEKFTILKDLLNKEPDETFLIVVNDIAATRKLSEALGLKSLTKKDLKNPLEYQTILDDLFAEQSIVVVPQPMIKSSLDLVQANRLIQYQLNTEISDIIQTQNRINRIGQKRETKAFYIATDQLQKNVIDLFLATYQNIRVAHKGIVELFVNLDSQVNVINDYIGKAMDKLTDNDKETTEVTDEIEAESHDIVDDQSNLIDDLIVNASHHQLQFIK